LPLKGRTGYSSVERMPLPLAAWAEWRSGHADIAIMTLPLASLSKGRLGNHPSAGMPLPLSSPAKGCNRHTYMVMVPPPLALSATGRTRHFPAAGVMVSRRHMSRGHALLRPYGLTDAPTTRHGGEVSRLLVPAARRPRDAPCLP